MRYSAIARRLGKTCRRCLNKRYDLGLTPEDCFYYRYKDECYSCHKTQNIVTGIRSRWKLWNAAPVAIVALALFVVLILGLRVVDVAAIQTTETGSVRQAAVAVEVGMEEALAEFENGIATDDGQTTDAATAIEAPGTPARVGFASLNLLIHQQLSVQMALYKATEWLGILAILIAAAFAVTGAIQLFRHGLRGVDPEIFALGGLYILVVAVYMFFEVFVVNCRPVLLDGQLEASFPSSHTMLACTVFGSTAMVLTRKRIPAQTLWVILLQVLMVLTVAGRLVSGIHWFTDVLGGVLISAALLAGFASVLKRVTEDRGD